MKKYLLLVASFLCISFAAQGAGFDNALTVLNPRDLATLGQTSVDSAADYLYLYDASVANVVKVLPGPGLVGSTSSATELNYLDIATLGTVEASKALTADASNDVTFPATYAGTFASSAAETFASGSTLSVAGTLAVTGIYTVDGVTVNKKALSLPGRVDITICGDGTTINNNTVYYGPSMVPVAGNRTCDITQAGNTTEATADEAALDATAFQVLSMDCLTADPGASGVSFTLRSAAAATTPSVTCSVANTKKGCTANIQTTVAIASGATIAIAAASAGNQGATPFICTIHAAY